MSLFSKIEKMHIPKVFQEKNIETLHLMIKSHSLGAWITSMDDELEVNHIPFILEPSSGEYGVLRGHVNKANPVWKLLFSIKKSVVIFQGPQAYISPSWYPSKEEHGKAVPTWNYVVVHVHGTPRAIEDKEWLLDHLNSLTNEHESDQEEPWQVSDAPADYIQQMLGGIVGIEIAIDKIVGSWKTSQNKQQSDLSGIVTGLNKRKDSQSIEMASYVSHHLFSTN